MADPVKWNLISSWAGFATGGHQSSLTLSHWDLRILLFLILQGVLLCFARENYEQTNVNEFEAKEPPFLFFGSCISACVLR